MLKELEDAYTEAIHQQASSRNRTLTGFDMKVADSIFTAGCLAIEDSCRNVAQSPTRFC